MPKPVTPDRPTLTDRWVAQVERILAWLNARREAIEGARLDTRR